MKARAAVLVAVAVTVAVSLMHGEAHAQTDIKIGVLLSHPDDIDAGPWEAMKLAERDLNREYVAIGSTVTLERIDVSDYLTDPRSAGQKILDALGRGYTHFIAPSDEGALGVVKGTVDEIVSIPSIMHNPILISPKSQTVVHPLYNSDDNLFRLTPNNDELAKVTIPVYDKYGTERLIMVIDAARGSNPFPAPEAVRDRFGHPLNPILVYSEDAPDSAEKNLQAATDLNRRLGELIATYGQDGVGVHYVSDVAHLKTFVSVINDNPNLGNLDSVRWYGTDAILVAEVTTDPQMAEFSAKVEMTVLAYEIVETPIVNELKALPNPSRLHNVYANYAAYDAVHLLADSIAIAGADSPNLKETIFEVSDGRHALEHTTRLLGEGALGDYMLDRDTGDLLGVGNFIEHRFIQGGSGYVWLEIFNRDVKIGVLTSHPDDIDAGPLEAMKLAERDLNSEYEAIGSTVTLKEIDVSDFTNAALVGQEIGIALHQGYTHFIAPSDEGALAYVKGIANAVAPNSILISPKSQTTIDPSFYANDNLFRFTPNNNELAKVTIPVFDKYGTERLIMVIDAARGGIQPFPAPEPVRDRFDSPLNPILVYSEDAPDSAEKNLQAATDLNRRLGELIATYGQDGVGVQYVSDVAHLKTFVSVINDNPNLDNLDNVRWYGTDAILVAEVTTDPLMAEFSAKVEMTVLAYEIVETPIVNELKALPNPSRLHNVYANYAAYDAVHLLADSIVIAGADSPNLKEVIFEVSDGRHALEHTTRLLGEGALGDYMLDRDTGDLTGIGNFIEHRFVQSNGGYVWLELFDRPVCR